VRCHNDKREERSTGVAPAATVGTFAKERLVALRAVTQTGWLPRPRVVLAELHVDRGQRRAVAAIPARPRSLSIASYTALERSTRLQFIMCVLRCPRPCERR
jgi:hypothetical protein